MTTIALHLTNVLLNPLIFLNSSCIGLYCWHIALLASNTTSAETEILLVSPSNGLARLGRLSTSMISKTKEKRLLSFNIILKIFSSKKLMTSSTLADHLFY